MAPSAGRSSKGQQQPHIGRLPKQQYYLPKYLMLHSEVAKSSSSGWQSGDWAPMKYVSTGAFFSPDKYGDSWDLTNSKWLASEVLPKKLPTQNRAWKGPLFWFTASTRLKSVCKCPAASPDNRIFTLGMMRSACTAACNVIASRRKNTVFSAELGNAYERQAWFVAAAGLLKTIRILCGHSSAYRSC